MLSVPSMQPLLSIFLFLDMAQGYGTPFKTIFTPIIHTLWTLGLLLSCLNKHEISQLLIYIAPWLPVSWRKTHVSGYEKPLFSIPNCPTWQLHHFDLNEKLYNQEYFQQLFSTLPGGSSSEKLHFQSWDAIKMTLQIKRVMYSSMNWCRHDKDSMVCTSPTTSLCSTILNIHQS